MVKGKVYIVAKITGLPEEEVIAKYAAAKSVVEAHGYEAVLPIDHVPVSSDWHAAMRICIPLMLSCDAYTCIDKVHTTAGGMIEDTIGQWMQIPRLHFSKI